MVFPGTWTLGDLQTKRADGASFIGLNFQLKWLCDMHPEHKEPKIKLSDELILRDISLRSFKSYIASFFDNTLQKSTKAKSLYVRSHISPWIICNLRSLCLCLRPYTCCCSYFYRILLQDCGSGLACIESSNLLISFTIWYRPQNDVASVTNILRSSKVGLSK
jgi:hypothetical protein